MSQCFLQRDQADDVLRYWLALLKLEEALDLRPQARRSGPQIAPLRTDLPTPGQDYFKVPLDRELARFLSEQQPLERRLEGEIGAFFEHWLYSQYPRNHEDGELSQLLCFPVVHLPRGELAGVLRCGVRLRFHTNSGSSFQVPTWSERKRGVYPDAPASVAMTQVPRNEGIWPFFFDTRLLNQTLGVPSEALDALFDGLRAHENVSEKQMLQALLATLEEAAQISPRSRQTSAGDRLEDLLERLTTAVRALLARQGSRARVYPVGIVLDATQVKSSWHLQRELRELLEADREAAWTVESCLGTYLTGRPLPSGESPQRALYPAPALTAQQRRAADRFWGSAFSTVQGPPGTGKTTLILHLCAEALVRQMEGLVESGTRDSGVFLITSSNNRAVDNVLDALNGGSGLPLALRAGSRQVCEQVLAPQLRYTLAYLNHAEVEPLAQRKTALAQASARFQSAREKITAAYEPRLRALAKTAELARAREALKELSQMADGDPADASKTAPEDLQLPEAQARPLLSALIQLEKRLATLSKLCEATPGLAQVNAVARHFGRTAANELPAFEAALSAAELRLTLPLPPLVTPLNPGELMGAWEDSAEQSLALLSNLRERLEQQEARATRARAARARVEEIGALRARMAQLEPEVLSGLPEAQADQSLALELFAAAVALREAWAKAQVSELRPALEAALNALEEQKSLRPLFRSAPQHARRLQQLFGLWGSTLLSLGNCLPSEPGSIARAVIDEAGQCHPAHAVCALMRCESALVIGDTQQLEPVMEVSREEEARLLLSLGLRTPPALLAPYRLHNRALQSTQGLAERADPVTQRLVDHFRCQRDIIGISNALCGYGLVVHTPSATRVGVAPFLSAPVAWLDLKGEQAQLGGSWCNELELQATLGLVLRLLESGIAAAEVAVITPYRGQLERLRRALSERRVPIEYSPEVADAGGENQRASEGLALGTVHRFQGGERSVVLFSSVITRAQSLGFLNGRPNLLNVAVSRARHHFIGIGDRSVMAQGNLTRLLMEHAHVLQMPA